MPDRWSASARTMTSTAAAAASAATTQRFDRHVSNATCRLVEINEHLLCALCSGYLVDATTIIECLHTFCRSCIVRYLESSETCPVCDVPLHQTNPLLGIRADTTLQTLVYKLVPGVFKDEVKRRCSVINNAHADGKSSSIMDRLLKDICDMTTGGTIYTADEQFSVCLQYAPSPSSSSDARYRGPCSKSSCAKSQQDLSDCSYLLCPASVTVAHLKKLIRNKLELSSDLPLDLYHSSPDGSLDDGYTLADVAYITAWTSVKPLHFYYQVNAKPSKKSTSKVAYVSEEAGCKRKVAHGSRSEKLPGGTCLKRVIASNRQKVKIKGVVFSSAHTKSPKAAIKEVKSLASKCLASHIIKGSSPQSPLSVEKSPTDGETGKGDQNSYSKNHCSQKDDCDSQDGNVTKVSLEEQNRVKSVEDYTSKEKDKLQTKASDRNSVELTELEVTDNEITQGTSSRIVNTETPKLSPNRQKSGIAECSPSADSALSPSRPETVTQSAMTVDSFETMSDAEGNVIDSASSPPPAKRTKIAEPNDRNLFAAINSMIVSNNDNVVSSSTSSQVSADDSGDNKTSVETQTSAKLISRRSRKGKLRTKKDPIIKSRSLKQNDCNDDTNAERVLPPSSGPSVVALSAHTSSQSISVAEHTFSTAVDTTTQCASATLCVPICIGDKTGGGSNLILNLPQNVSVQCRIRSDKILIASNPTATAANTEIASATFSSIAYSQTTTISTDAINVSPNATSQPSPCLTSHVVSPSATSQASPSVTSQAPLSVKSPGQPIITSSGPPNGTSITQTSVTSVSAPCITSSAPPSLKSLQVSDDNGTASPLPRQLDRRTIPENKGNVCKNSVTSLGDYEASDKELKAGAIRRTVNLSDASIRFRNKDKFQGCTGDVPTQPKYPGNSETKVSVTCVSSPPIGHEIPIRSPKIVLSDTSTLEKPRCQSDVSVVAVKPTCFKKTPGLEASGTKAQYSGVATDLDMTIRDKESQNVATTLQHNPVTVTTNVCKTISRPKEVVQASTSVVSTNSAAAARPSAVSTTKAVLFKPYQIATTASHMTSPKRSADGITATATFQCNTHHNVLYSTPTFPVFPNFQYPKNQPSLSHQGDVSKAYHCVITDSVLASSASCELTKSGMSAVHRTMSNIPLHSVIKVPTYTARKMPQNKKSEKKCLKSPQNESNMVPVASVSILRKSESCLGSQVTLGQKTVKVDKFEGKLLNHPVSDFMREEPLSKGSQSCDEKVVLQTTKGTKDDLSHGKVDEGWNQLKTSSVPPCLKLPLVSADILDKGDASSCSISTSSNEQSAVPTCELETAQKTTPTKRRLDFPGSSGNDQRLSPKQRSEKTCPQDEMSYTYAEADSGTSPGAISLSPPRCGSKNETPSQGLSPNLQELSATGTSLRKKLVIDLERCSPRQNKVSGTNYAASPSVSTSVDQRLHCCSPTTTIHAVEPPPLPPSGPVTPPRLVISLPRCQVPAPTTFLSPSGCLSQWSPTSSSVDNSPPTTKRLKLMCNGMTIYRTLESPGPRSPRRASGGGGGGGRKSSPVSAPVAADCPSSLLSRASSCKSPSTPQGKCRRKSNGGSAPVVSAGVEKLKSVVVTGGEPAVVISVDSTSTSPRTAATTVSLSNNNGLFTVVPAWKGLERSVSLPEIIEEPLELTTKEVKERQKEREYAKLMSNLRPPSAFTT